MLLSILAILGNATKTNIPFENFWNVNVTDCIIAGSAAIALGFGIYTAQKWQSRQTEIADKQYQLNAFLEIFKKIDDPEHTSARKLLNEVKNNPYQREFYQTNFGIIRRTFDMLGMLYIQNSIPRKMVLQSYWHMIIECWNNMKPYIMDIRTNAEPLFATSFETLYNEAVKFKENSDLLYSMINVPTKLDEKNLLSHVPTFDTEKK